MHSACDTPPRIHSLSNKVGLEGVFQHIARLDRVVAQCLALHKNLFTEGEVNLVTLRLDKELLL